MVTEILWGELEHELKEPILGIRNEISSTEHPTKSSLSLASNDATLVESSLDFSNGLLPKSGKDILL